jgi:transposase InsO family protein
LPVSRAADLLGVSRSLVYRERADPSPRLDLDRQLQNRIEELALEYPCIGYRMVTHHLAREGTPVNSKRVRRVMRTAGLVKRRRRRWVKTTDSEHGLKIFPNLMKGYPPTGLNQVWVADITYVRLPNGFCFLAVILDAYSRRVIGWRLAEEIDASLAVAALEMAIRARCPPPGFVHHSDRGVQYACRDYVDRLIAHAARISMSAKGTPRDNAQAESFFRTLKTEEVYVQDYQSVAEARLCLEHFIEQVYNQKRLHSSIGYRPPIEYEDHIKQRPLPGNQG